MSTVMPVVSAKCSTTRSLPSVVAGELVERVNEKFVGADVGSPLGDWPMKDTTVPAGTYLLRVPLSCTLSCVTLVTCREPGGIVVWSEL